MGADVAHILIDIVLIGVIALFTTKKLGKRQAVIPASVPEGWLEQPGIARREPFEPAHAEPPPPVPAATGLPASADSPSYLLGGRRTGRRSDRMAAALAMMAGPGICTPNETINR